MNQNMFCFQCEQTAGCSGCTGVAGVCGKSASTSALQDELTGALIGLVGACENNKRTKATDRMIIEGLFTTVTNVNFNDDTLRSMIDQVHAMKNRIVPRCGSCSTPCGNTSDYDLFISPNVLQYLVENYHIAPISTPEKDLEKLLAGA